MTVMGQPISGCGAGVHACGGSPPDPPTARFRMGKAGPGGPAQDLEVRPTGMFLKTVKHPAEPALHLAWKTAGILVCGITCPAGVHQI